ncbi:Zinc finger BED domain-containing protein 5 [Araneus ventricosus]|uniref:Zinc finger BED domain-containing protein 5 n=1 Tax=Araneus ventricosus TaxID=182803 RepID=A0A4Y2UUI5_ARAVE|nr:Zinc finger BED domain-containing protein 5 [Araneus ventricosus]
MDRWLENGSLKKTDVVSSNAEIAESKHMAILEPTMQSTSSSIQLQPHLPILDKWYQRKDACNPYALQLDESTDVAGIAIFLVFVRYDFNKKIEDLLLCESVNIDTTGENIFNCIDNFMTTHEINWGKCIEVCSDGAKAMTGKVRGVVARIKNVAKNCNSTHCILHRYALVTKKISATFKSVLDEAVKIINFIKSKPLQSRIFKAMCKDMGSLHTTLLLHTEVRWLSRGKMLVRIFELRMELMAYFIGHKFELSDRLNNMAWLSTLAYLAYIFGKLNELCLALQGKQVNILQAKDKLVVFSRKIQYLISAVEQNNFECFQTLSDFLEESEVDLDMKIRDGIKTHLSSLQQSLSDYFPNLENQYNYCVQNPFKIKEKPKGFHSMDYENLIELSSDAQLEAKFRTVSLTIFWSDVFDEYPNFAKQAIRILLPFATTYLCEAGFSKYVATKTKYRNKLDAAPDMRIQLSNLTLNFKSIKEAGASFTLKIFHLF